MEIKTPPMAEVDTTAPAATANLVDQISEGLANKGKKETVVTEPVKSLATDIEAGKDKVEPSKEDATIVTSEKTEDANTEFEALATFLDEKEETVKTTETEKTKEVVAGEKKTTETDYTEYINKAKEYDETMSIPLIKAVADLVKSGKTDLLEIANEIGFQNVDKIPAREVYETGLKAEGYSEDAIAEAMDEFDGLKLIAQDKLAKPYRAELKQKQDEKLKNLTSGLPQIAKEQQEAQRIEQERVAKVTSTASEELQNKVNALKGKKYEGLLNITEEMIPQIMKVAGTLSTPVYDDNGTKIIGYDLETGIEAAILKLHKKSIIKAALTTGGTEAFLKFYKARVNPKSNEHSTAAPVVERGIKDAVNDILKQTGRNS